MKIKSVLPALAASALSVLSASAQVGVDGTIGAEWAGITPRQVLYNPAAPVSNFGAPTGENNVVAYSIWMRNDSNFIYVGVRANPAGPGNDAWNAGLVFANLYFDLNPLVVSGSDLGFEIGMNQFHAFIPGGASGSTANLTLMNGFFSAISQGTDYANGGTGGVVEVAIPWSYLEGGYAADGLTGVPLVDHTDNTLNTVRLNLSQSMSYSVAGGAATYGYERLGVVPEPGTVIGGIAAAGLLGVTAMRRFRQQRSKR